MKESSIKEKQLEFVKKLGLTVYNVTYNPCLNYFCINGINGQATTIHTTDADWKKKISTHLKKMGKDKFKLELQQMFRI
jgi:hypothetical protein